MEPLPDIAIVGGGIIGLTTAYILAREGCRVLVLDKGDFGQEASWAGAGIIPAGNLSSARTPIDLLRAHSTALFPALSDELKERTGIDNGYRRCGGLEFLDTGNQGDCEGEEWHSEGGATGPHDTKQLAELEPALGDDLGPALYLPDMAQVRNPRHLRALQAACRQLGVTMRAQCPIRGLQRTGNRVTALLTGDSSLTAGKYLIATGAWTDQLMADLGWHPGIKPIRGQMLLLSCAGPPCRRILLWGAHYLVSRNDGHVLIGSTEEDVGFEKRNTAIAVGELLALACRLVPNLRDATLERCWSGLRPASPNGLPYLGRVPEFDNLYAAAGHFRAGIFLSPGTALVMKELLLGQTPTMSLEAFRLDR